MRLLQKNKMKSSVSRHSRIDVKKKTRSPHETTIIEVPWGKNQLISGSYSTDTCENDIIYKPQLNSTHKKSNTSRVMKTINKFIIG